MKTLLPNHSSLLSSVLSLDMHNHNHNLTTLIEYMMSGPVCCMVWVGMGAVKTGRVMLGATKPSDSAPGTIRGDFAIDVGRNICHGSDAVESAGIIDII
jgi:nucleoside diphosphate kinase